jgi:UrcA family protein
MPPFCIIAERVRNIVAHISCDLGLIGWSRRRYLALKQEETTMKAITIIVTSFAIATGVIKAAPALAQEPAAVNVSLVRTADLDLGSTQGQRKLDQRLANAAREVCGTASDVDVEGKNEVRKCRDDTLANAKGQRDAVLAAATRGAIIAVTASR